MIIPDTWSIPEAARSRIGHTTYGRQRAIIEAGHVLLVLHKPPGPDDRAREGVLFWRDPAGEWRCNRSAGNAAEALKLHVQAYVDIEGRLTNAYENATTTEQLFTILEELTPIERAANNMYLVLQTAREAIKADPLTVEVRDLASEAARNVTLLVEDVRNAVQYRMAREAEEQSHLTKEALQASHRLNVLAALFFPLTAITSLFGMNLQHGLNEHSTMLFWFVFAGGVALGFAIKAWVLGKPVAATAGKQP